MALESNGLKDIDFSIFQYDNGYRSKECQIGLLKEVGLITSGHHIGGPHQTFKQTMCTSSRRERGAEGGEAEWDGVHSSYQLLGLNQISNYSIIQHLQPIK